MLRFVTFFGNQQLVKDLDEFAVACAFVAKIQVGWKFYETFEIYLEYYFE